MNTEITGSEIREASSNNWYIIYTKPGFEKKVAAHLAKRKVTTYCPVHSSVTIFGTAKRFPSYPLFPSYVFAKIDKSSVNSISQTTGVINMVYWQNRLAIVRDEEVRIIENLLLNYSDIHIEKIKVNADQPPLVEHGTLLVREEGMVKVCNDGEKAVLPSLGYVVLAKGKRTSSCRHRVFSKSAGLMN
jgi:transcription antitermination factor NusG